MTTTRNLIWIFMLPLLVALSACSMVEQPETPCPVEVSDNKISLSFRMMSSNITRDTRADNQGHEETDSEWQDFEDAINERDFAFFIFLGEEEDAPLIIKVENIFQSKDPDLIITGGFGAYTISLTIPKKILEDKLGRELNPESYSAIQFRIVLLANCYSPGNGGDYQGLNPASYRDLIDKTAEWSFNMSEIHNYTSDGGDYTIDGIYKGFIPMFGTRLFSATEKDLYASRPDNRIWLGEMWLLRSLAKVRVVDNIKKEGGAIYPRISRAEIVSSTATSRPLPYDAVNYADGEQVHEPNILTTEDSGNMNYILGVLSKGSKNMFGYIPEQAIKDNLPEFKVTVDINETKSETYLIPMSGYKQQTLDFGKNILRNHIYTLQINAVKLGVPADITVSVKEWTPFSLNLDYTDQVNVSKPISWTASSVADDDTDAGVVVMLPWHDDESSPAECSFTIDTPLGATWTASLIATEGAQGAFKFLDAEGNQVNTISGTIDGKETRLRIVTTDAAPPANNSARLQVVVSLANWKYMEAQICGNKIYKNYTITQNKQ